jgi:hypothetical protein
VTLLRSGLLEGRAVAASGGVPVPVVRGLAALGARVVELGSGLDEDDARDWAASHAPLHALVYDTGEAFGGGGEAGLSRALERAWVATRAVATGALIPGGAGKVLLIAPRLAGGGRFARAAQAALENLARTLSVEWARYGVTAVAIGRGAAISADGLAELVCFLVSPAGDYFSGCRFELGLIQTS